MSSFNMIRDFNNDGIPDHAIFSNFATHHTDMPLKSVQSTSYINQEFGKSISCHQLSEGSRCSGSPNDRNDNSALNISLENSDMWKSFAEIGTEMIVTRAGRRTSRAKRKSSSDEEFVEEDIYLDCSIENKRRRMMQDEAHSMFSVNYQYDDIFKTRSVFNKYVPCRKPISSSYNTKTMDNQDIWTPDDCPAYERNSYDIPQYEHPTGDEQCSNIQYETHQKYPRASFVFTRNGNEQTNKHMNIDLNGRHNLLDGSSWSLKGICDTDQTILPNYDQNTGFGPPPGHYTQGETSRARHNFITTTKMLKYSESPRKVSNLTSPISHCNRENIKTIYSEENCETLKNRRIISYKAELGSNNPPETIDNASSVEASSGIDIVTIGDHHIDRILDVSSDVNTITELIPLTTDDVEAVLMSMDTRGSSACFTSSHAGLNSDIVTNDIIPVKECTEKEPEKTELSFASLGQDILREAFNLTFFSE